MNPDQLSAKGTEHGIQAAFFAWCAMAQRFGYEVADDMTAYDKAGFTALQRKHGTNFGMGWIDQLAWIHSIPNGGKRDAVTGAMLKAEGLKTGIADVFLPYPIRTRVITHGLYIEFKTTVGKQSTDQKAFELYCTRLGYVYVVCRSWREAANAIKEYLTC